MENENIQKYNDRTKRFSDAISLKTPDRIPISIEDEGFFVKYGGLTWSDVMYDTTRAIEAAKRLCLDLDQDTHIKPYLLCPGQVYDILNFKQIKWPGASKIENSLEDPNSIFQFVEPGTDYEGMNPEEYEWFIEDPSDFILRGFWPRVSSTLGPLRKLSPVWQINSYSRLNLLSQFADPEVKRAFKALIEAGEYCLEFGRMMREYMCEMVTLGYPPRSIGVCSQPFDYFGDYMRGTIGRMLDMYRNKEKMIEAIEKVSTMILKEVSKQAGANAKILDNLMPNTNHLKNVFMYLHGGAEGLMSDMQYKEFYWPSLKSMIIGLIEKGFTPFIFSEGIYNSRFDIIRDIPAGKAVWHVESDVFKAKEALGDICCISGGPPSSMLESGNVDDIKEYSKKVIRHCGKNGGFIMGVSQAVLTAKYENLKALIEVTREFGQY